MGDYGDPARIHGTPMPGLQQLQAGHERVRVSYEQVAAGARITCGSSDPALVAALHAWFDAQTSDHSMPGAGRREARNSTLPDLDVARPGKVLFLVPSTPAALGVGGVVAGSGWFVRGTGAGAANVTTGRYAHAAGS